MLIDLYLLAGLNMDQQHNHRLGDLTARLFLLYLTF